MSGAVRCKATHQNKMASTITSKRYEHKARPRKGRTTPTTVWRTMQRRDINPARPNGLQGLKIMSKHCKEQKSLEINRRPSGPKPKHSVNIGRGTQEEEKEEEAKDGKWPRAEE